MSSLYNKTREEKSSHTLAGKENNSSSVKSSPQMEKKFPSGKSSTSSKEGENLVSPIRIRIIRSKTRPTSPDKTKENKFGTKSKIINASFIVSNTVKFLSNEDMLNFARAIPSLKILLPEVIFEIKENCIDSTIRDISFLPNLKKVSISAKQLSSEALETLFTFAKLEYLQLDSLTEQNKNSLLCLNKLTTLSYLAIHDSQIKNISLPHLPSVTKLELKANINDTQILTSLSNLLNLEKLFFRGKVTVSHSGNELQFLSTLSKLKHFTIYCQNEPTTNFIEKTLRYLPMITNLESLSLVFCDYLNEEVMRGIARLVNLKTLFIEECLFYSPHFDHFSTLVNLEELILNCTAMSDSYSITQNSLNTIANFTRLRKLDFYEGDITSLQPLRNLTQLTKLSVCYCPELTREEIEFIKEFKLLTYLDLSSSFCPKNILEITSELLHLESLIVGDDEPVEINNISYLLSNQKLILLNLGVCKVNNEDMKIISQLKELENLVIKSAIFDDTCLELITSLENLRSLNISSNMNVTASGIQHLTKLKHLIRLNISGCVKVGKEILSYLSEFPKLKILNLNRTRISKEELANFKQNSEKGIEIFLGNEENLLV
jgi:hypothetical protein